jgi:hypothetical protein
MLRMSTMSLSFFIFGLCSVCSTAAHADKADTLAKRLGYEGCKVSKPLTIAQVMAKDMSGGNEASRAHPDWDELLAKHTSGDQVYFVDCRKADSSRIFAGTALYVLVREGVVIAHASEY